MNINNQEVKHRLQNGELELNYPQLASALSVENPTDPKGNKQYFSINECLIMLHQDGCTNATQLLFGPIQDQLQGGNVEFKRNLHKAKKDLEQAQAKLQTVEIQYAQLETQQQSVKVEKQNLTKKANAYAKGMEELQELGNQRTELKMQLSQNPAVDKAQQLQAEIHEINRNMEKLQLKVNANKVNENQLHQLSQEHTTTSRRLQQLKPQLEAARQAWQEAQEFAEIYNPETLLTTNTETLFNQLITE